MHKYPQCFCKSYSLFDPIVLTPDNLEFLLSITGSVFVMRRRSLRCVGLLLAVSAFALPARELAAQGKHPDAAAADSLRKDSTAARTLARVRVSVARSDVTAQTAPWALGVRTKTEIGGARSTLGIDEALPNIPGVYVANRYNYALDQRLSIRGAGARANFGMRGVKVLLDGVPQSLPDGQSQLTNIDLADITRVEVLRGSASSLYGNGAGGVVSFSTDRSAPDPLGESVRITSGSYGMTKLQERTSGRVGGLVGALSWSRTTLDGFRQYDRSDTRQILGSLDYALNAATTLALSVSAADIPKALNPGALTAAEYAANRDSASAVNIRRGASREVSQQQYAFRVHHTSDDAGEWSAVVFVHRRFVDNALATPPPAPAGSTNGIYSTINRWVTGVRLDGSRLLCDCFGAPQLSGGLDYERSFDIRRNRRSSGGRPVTGVDTLLVFQDEVVTAVGAFAQLQWKPVTPMTVSTGVRYDQLHFAVRDHFMADGTDNSASRTMTSPSWHIGATYIVNDALTPYATFSTAFQTPTTTELQARTDGLGGFNAALGPQHEQTIEGGARGAFGARVTYTASVFHSLTDGAIIQFLETNGRAFFRNAGRTQNDGIELGLAARAASWLDLSAAWTFSSYTFTDYRVQNGATVDTLDGRTQPGVPDHFVRLGLRAHWQGASIDVDHTLSSAMWADDRNTQRIEGWGSGVVNVRASWSGTVRDLHLQPFVAVNNLTSESYVGAVTLNGAGGRTIEPAPLRNFYFGMEIGWRAVKER